MSLQDAGNDFVKDAVALGNGLKLGIEGGKHVLEDRLFVLVDVGGDVKLGGVLLGGIADDAGVTLLDVDVGALDDTE